MAKEYEIAFRLGAELESSFSKSFHAASTDFRKLQKQVQDLSRGTGTASTTKPVRDDLRKTQAEMRNTESSTNKMISTIKKAGSAVAGFFAVRKVVNVGKDFVRTFANFEQSMANVRAVSGLDKMSEDFQKLTAKAREMGEKTSKSASEAADGLQYLALAGWDTEQMLAGIEPILRLSEAGAIDLGRASDLATDSMAALGIEVQELLPYLDKVAQTSRRSNTSVQQLMDAFLVAGGTFKTFNVPLEEATSLLGIMANRGYKGTEAGTAMNAIVTNLTSGMGQAGKAMDELKISAFDVHGNFKGLEKVFREVKSKLDPMTDSQKAQYIAMIAGKEHLKTFTGLLDGLGKEYDELKNHVYSADGALMEMAETQMDTFAGAMKIVESAIESAKITLGEKLAPTIRQAAEAFSEWLPNAVDKFEKKLPSLIKTGKALIPILGGIATASATIKVGRGVSDLINTLGTVRKFSKSATSSVGMFGSAVGFLANPVGIAVAAVGALAIGVSTFRRNQEMARKELIRMGDQLKATSKRYNEVADKSKKTHELVQEYEQLSEVIETNTSSAEELTAAKERLVEVTSILQALYPDTISQYDIENGRIKDKIDLLKQEASIEMEIAKLQLEKEVRESADKLPKLTKEIGALREQTSEIRNQIDAYKKAEVAFKGYELEYDKIMKSPAYEREEKLADLLERANQTGETIGRSYNQVGEFLGTSKEFNQKIKKLADQNITKLAELDEAEKSYEELYKAQKTLLELDLGGKLEDQAKKYNELSEVEKKRFNEALEALKELNYQMDLLSSDRKISVRLLYEESGQIGNFSPTSHRVEAFAEGAVVSRPTLSWVGEGGDTEVVVPINNKPRSHALLETANRMMGRSNSGDISVTFAPQVTVNGGSPEVHGQIMQILKQQEDDFMRKFKAMLKQEGRLAF